MMVGSSGLRPDDGYIMTSAEFEVAKWKGHAKHVEDECGVKLETAHISLDREKAKYIHLLQKYKKLRRDAIDMYEGHAEYQSIIRRGQGKTISEVLDQVDELYAACLEEKERSGPESIEFLEVLRNLKDVTFIYRVVSARRPEVRQFLSAEAGVSTSATVTNRDWDEFEQLLGGGRRGHQQTSVPDNRRIASAPANVPRQRGPVAPRSRTAPRRSSPVGRQQRPPQLSLNEILNLPMGDQASSSTQPPPAEDVCSKWFSFSLRRHRGL